ncbi:MAG: S26 family signal peptidase [Alphaproteobacteria bacterium]|nr:S26 family signal peptidase [Alphaproteobacteria bacterium]
MALAHRRIAIVAGIAAIGLVAMGSASSQDVMLYNGTPSMPVGFYLRTSGAVERGAIVTVRAVDVAPGYVAERNFTDPGDRFLKRVVGAAGDVVCASGAEITLNGALVAERQARDSAGRALPTWSGCVTLDGDHAFLLGDTPDSFDSRYWGPTPIDRIEGVWRPMRLPWGT